MVYAEPLQDVLSGARALRETTRCDSNAANRQTSCPSKRVARGCDRHQLMVQQGGLARRSVGAENRLKLVGSSLLASLTRRCRDLHRASIAVSLRVNFVSSRATISPLLLTPLQGRLNSADSPRASSSKAGNLAGQRIPSPVSIRLASVDGAGRGPDHTPNKSAFPLVATSNLSCRFSTGDRRKGSISNIEDPFARSHLCVCSIK